MQVFMRYFIRKPLLWSEELARYCMVIMTFASAFIAVKKGILANIDLLVTKLNRKIQKGIKILVDIGCIVLLMFLCYESILMLFEYSVVNQVAPALRIPMGIVYSIMPIGMIGMIFQFVVNICEKIFQKEAEAK
jgi:TRAP-type C4-dicarboxylate transport system permease small subunit